MSKTAIELAPEVAGDFARILDHLDRYNANERGERIAEIITALDVLAGNPRIGRPAADGNRELVIGRRAHGYLALYHYVEEVGTVLALAIRSQREAGYAD